jgi:hypothetical protein
VAGVLTISESAKELSFSAIKNAEVEGPLETIEQAALSRNASRSACAILSSFELYNAIVLKFVLLPGYYVNSGSDAQALHKSRLRFVPMKHKSTFKLSYTARCPLGVLTTYLVVNLYNLSINLMLLFVL